MAEELNKQVIPASNKRRLQGVVISNKMEKTIVVETETYRNHPVYKNRVSFRKKSKVDARNSSAFVGYFVIFEVCRLFSLD